MDDALGQLGKAVLDTSPDLIIVLDGELRVILHNAQAAVLVQKAGLAPTSPASTASTVVWGTVLVRAKQGEIVDFTTAIDGRSYDVHVHPVPPDRVVIHARDVTATKAAERGRQRLLDAIPDLVAIVRRDGQVAVAKEAQDSAAHLTLAEVRGPKLSAAIEESFRTPSPIVFEHEVVFDRVPRLREVHVRAISDDEAVVIVRDVTAQRLLTSQLMVADRMASLGTLAAGVAHEINNPLAYVIANLSFIEEELRTSVRENAPVPISDLLGTIAESNEGLARMAVIVKDLKTFSRPDEETAVDVDVDRLLDRVLAMARNELKYRTHVEKTYGKVSPVRANEARLGQVFLNLIVNAAQALDATRFERNVIRIRTGTLEGKVVIEVADNGPGIPPEHRTRVFDPFFTTKPVGVGTGLGLAICLGIVKSLSGEIQLESAVGVGTIFRVILPATKAIANPERTSFGQIPIRAASRRILAIDDDPLILSALGKLLRDHEVIPCKSAFEALHRFESGEQFDLVLCDVMMPHMTGVELYEAVARRWPGEEKQIAFMTGGAVTVETRTFLERTNATVLEKPFTPGAVQDCLQRLSGAKVSRS
jgi:signal transduction histidine kinase